MSRLLLLRPLSGKSNVREGAALIAAGGLSSVVASRTYGRTLRVASSNSVATIRIGTARLHNKIRHLE